MKVKAIAMGYDGFVRIKPDTVFDMPEEKMKKGEDGQPVLPKWVVPADYISPKKAKKLGLNLPGAKIVKKPADEAKALSQASSGSTGDSDVI